MAKADTVAMLAALDEHDAALATGLALKDKGRQAEAIFFLRRAVTVRPRSVRAWFFMGLCHEMLGRFPEAVTCYGRAHELFPDNAGIMVNLAGCLEFLGQYDLALDYYLRAMQDDGVSGQAGHGAAANYLRRGHFDDGWRIHELRRRIKGNESFGGNLVSPEWQGEPLAGKRLLVLSEQGAGDLFQFIRYARVAAEMGATVHAMTSNAVQKVIARADGVSASLTTTDSADYDYWLHAMSFPYVLKTREESIPAWSRYIHADPEKTAKWEKVIARHAKGRRRVGVVWAGNHTQARDVMRSIPLRMLAPWWELEDIAWFSLQKGRGAEELAELPGTPLINLGASFEDFSDTAGAIDQLDLVISVCTSVAHLAGALGKPMWAMLHVNPDWRWMLDRTDCPWYPSARLFRQKRLGDWSDVVADIGNALCRM